MPPIPPIRGGEPPAPIRAAIHNAAEASGVPFRYLVTQAAMESGFRPEARAATSSAAGLYQFIESTWLDLMRQHGDRFGLGDLARARDPDSRRKLLDLRHDADLSAGMAGEYARANRAALKAATGAEPGPTELYLAHFLGPGGATKILAARAADPQASAAALLPQAAAANRAMFYGADGTAKSVQDLYQRIAAKFDEPALAVEAPAPAPARRATDNAAAPVGPPGIEAYAQRVRGAVLAALSGRALSPLSILALAALDEVGDPMRAERGTRP